MSEMPETVSGTYDPAKIAIVIPTYNACDTIERAVASACAQSLPDGYMLEVIVVDDCSTDATPAIVEGLCTHYAALRFVRQPKNAGPSAARNRALEGTDAAWFAPLDSDDFMAPNRLASLLDIALEGDWDMVADNLLMSYDEAPDVVVRHLWEAKPAGRLALSLALFVKQNLRASGDRSELGYIKPLIDRSAVAGHPVYRADMRFGEDYDLYTRLLVSGARACLIDPQGYYAVQRRGSLSRSQKATDFGRLIQSDLTLLATPNLPAEAQEVVKRHLRESRNEWVWLRAIEAVKTKRILAFISCFFVTLPASWSLIGKLVEHVFVRAGASVSDNQTRVAGG